MQKEKEAKINLPKKPEKLIDDDDASGMSSVDDNDFDSGILILISFHLIPINTSKASTSAVL